MNELVRQVSVNQNGLAFYYFFFPTDWIIGWNTTFFQTWLNYMVVDLAAINPTGLNAKTCLYGNTLVIAWYQECMLLLYIHRGHSGCGLSQWNITLHCNVTSHWLSPYPEWSLHTSIMPQSMQNASMQCLKLLFFLSPRKFPFLPDLFILLAHT